MCSSSSSGGSGSSKVVHPPTMPSPRINGRPVLQPTSNRNNNNNSSSNGRSTSNNSASVAAKKKLLLPPISPSPSPPSITPPSPKSKSPKLRGSTDNNSVDDYNNKSSNKNKKDQVDALSRPPSFRSDVGITMMKSKSFNGRISSTTSAPAINGGTSSSPLRYSSSSPGSLAAIRREQMALQQAQRKMRIAHYGRSKSARFDSKVAPFDCSNSLTSPTETRPHEEKRCSFITANSDPLYVAYHDEEWGVPVHDDNLLFELLVLSGAQVGSDWTSILSKRQDIRNAFAGFNAERVAKFTDKQIAAISSEYGIDVGRVRSVVDNSNCILKVKKEFGSLDKYVWSFVNLKPIATQYKACHKIPVKTSKSESISKDMVRRGFRNVGPTVIHSFMQAAGLTNDHLVTCHRQLKCAALALQPHSYP